jgi:hypothetical protein
MAEAVWKLLDDFTHEELMALIRRRWQAIAAEQRRVRRLEEYCREKYGDAPPLVDTEP